MRTNLQCFFYYFLHSYCLGRPECLALCCVLQCSRNGRSRAVLFVIWNGHREALKCQLSSLEVLWGIFLQLLSSFLKKELEEK